ncbi:tRNA-dihydrouridine synthase [Desulfopila sp. IMCC35008]|uniref:tRNA dihydrouridine synthase n=1 Tax=Desulfopila sp. IMCC35008 TaxID=2653858 RepID=UPI0013D35106|nr:tRNA-dihydrouridine synthase family protein [Desulfopila sp. IMCC35008]
MNSETALVSSNTLHLRHLTVSPPVALAPMVGLSHSAMRSMLLSIGGVGLLYTEMLAARHIPHENPQSSPFLVRGKDENPLVYQIYISDEKYVPETVKKLELIGADGIDINLGCPAPQVRRSGAGAFLAEDQQTVRKIVGKMRKSTELPISAKIRLGRTLDRQKLINFCRMLEGEGIDMIAAHARLHGEKFCRTPRWAWVGHVKECVKIPVLANGGIFSIEDARRCLEVTGADGLMLGRGAIENPFLMKEIGENIFGAEKSDCVVSAQDHYIRFIELLEDRFALERRLGRLKQYTHYFSRAFKFGHQLATTIQKSENIEDAKEKAGQFFARNKPDMFFPS